MNGEELYVASEHYRPFPNPQDVFYIDVERHSEYLLPVGILSLNYLYPDLAGDLPIVIPVEPADGWGVLGEESTPYHNYLCRENWIGYSLHENKLQLACDFRYFHKAYYAAHPPDNAVCKQEAAELDAYYIKTRRHFQAAANHFRQYGWLCSALDQWDPATCDPEDFRVPLISNLGGISCDGNWDSGDFSTSRKTVFFEDEDYIYEHEQVLPQTEDGRDFAYIAQVKVWNYFDHTNGILLVFFDPQDQVVLTTIDWT